MKIIEVIGGMRIPVYNFENALFEKIKEKNGLGKSQLSEREQEIARNMLSRGILKRAKRGDQIVYKVNEMPDTWREHHD
jgi:hypothetical protein